MLSTRSGAVLCLAIEDVVTPSDAAEVVEELLPAQNKSYELGLKLNLPPYEVENTHSSYSKQEKRLLHVIMQFLNQAEPRPTWRVIIDALRSRLVNLPQLGQELAACHFLEPIPSCVPEVAGKRSRILVLSSSYYLSCSVTPSCPAPTSSSEDQATGNGLSLNL